MDIKEFAGGLAVIDGEVYEKIMVRRADSGRVSMEYIRNIKDIDNPGLTKVIRETSTGPKEVYINFGKCNISEIQRVCECDAMFTTFKNGYVKGMEVGITHTLIHNGAIVTSFYTPSARLSTLGKIYYIDVVLASKNDTVYVRLKRDAMVPPNYRIKEMFKDGASIVYSSIDHYSDDDRSEILDDVYSLLSTSGISDIIYGNRCIRTVTSLLNNAVMK